MNKQAALVSHRQKIARRFDCAPQPNAPTKVQRAAQYLQDVRATEECECSQHLTGNINLRGTAPPQLIAEALRSSTRLIAHQASKFLFRPIARRYDLPARALILIECREPARLLHQVQRFLRKKARSVPIFFPPRR